MTPWHEAPATRSAIARLVLTGEAPEVVFEHYPLTREEYRTYTGPLGQRVTAIYEAESRRLFAETTVADDYDAFTEFCGQPRPAQAIDAVYRRMALHLNAETRMVR